MGVQLMGRAPESKRLKIIIDLEFKDEPDIQALVDKGHTILYGDKLDEYAFGLDEVDLILSKKAHYWIKDMFGAGLLEIALKKARERKRDTH